MIETIGTGILVPLLAALAVANLWDRFARRRQPEDAAGLSIGWPFAVGFAVAVALGYVLLPSWAELRPTRHWQWVPYMAIVAALVGPVGARPGHVLSVRYLIAILVIGVAVVLVVPDWEDLQPARIVWIAGAALQMILVTELLDRLPAHRRGAGLLMLLAACLACMAVVLAIAVSLTFGQVAAVVASALAGVALAGVIASNATSSRSLHLAYAVAATGLAISGYLNAATPMVELLALPLVCLAVWFCVPGPLGRWTGARSAVAQVVAVGIPATVLVARLILAGGPMY